MLEFWLDCEFDSDCECELVRRVWIGIRGEGGMGIKYSRSASISGAEA